MNRNLISLALAMAVVIPTTACASQLFKKTDKTVSAATETAPKTNPDNVAEAAKALDGEWVILSVGDQRINRDEDYPYIHFVPEQDSFYASNGCNVLNGVYTLDKADEITFHNVITTMKYCADAPFDGLITSALAEEKPVKFVYTVENGEEYLTIGADTDKNQLRLRKQSLGFLNGNWRVTEIDGKSVDSTDLTIFFDMAERRVHGNTGCNSFNGDIFLEPQQPGKMSLTNMAVTMRLCPNIELQTKFMVALEQTAGAKREGANVYLTDSSGKAVVRLIKD